ncbi:PAS domain S-box protein [Hoeflea sp. AS60]|uniref:sensor histidine kinase n=1 Tax=Hoeflea sp. AS60 TaxID=3135780 RepID=UPI00317A3C20
MSLMLRLVITMSALAILTAAATGILIYKRSVNTITPIAFQNLEAQAGVLADSLDDYVGNAQEDVFALSHMQVVSNIAELNRTGGVVGGKDINALRQQLSADFLAIGRAKQRYAQIRLIGANDDGRELVRVNRQGLDGSLEVVPDEKLQSKAGRDYFSAVMALPNDAIYVSDLNYNREYGTLEKPYIPTLRIATPLPFATGSSPGMIIINLDMRQVLEQLPKKAPRDSSIYLIDREGKYLISPEPGKAFDFEFGDPSLFQNDWPSLRGVESSEKPATGLTTAQDGTPLAYAAWPTRLAGELPVTLIQMIPLSTLLGAKSTIAKSSMITGFLATLFAIVAAVGIAASLTRPLRAIVGAIGDAGAGRPVHLPDSADGEAGAIARAFGRYLEKEALLGAIVNSSVDAMVSVDLNGAINSWNPAAEKLYGYTATEAIGMQIDSLVPEDRREELVEGMRRVAKGEKISEFETVKIDKSGIAHDVSLTMAPIRDAAGLVVGVSRIGRDITQKLTDEKRLRRLQAEAAHASRINAAGQMAGALAHELNQPLTAMVNYARSARRVLAKRDFPADDDVIKYIDKAADQGQRAGGIIRRLRKFIGNREQKVERADINQVIEEGLEAALLEKPKQPIEIKRNYAEQLSTIPIDRIQIQQVVANLLRNAVEAMEKSSTRTLTVETADAGDFVAVIIGDTGPGLSDDAWTHLFEAFSTTKEDGMGIGLTISRSIVETHGGKMEVHSDLGGATFRFTLPKQQA